MASKILSTIGLFSIFALLIGAGGAAPELKVRTPAKAISEIPITHHFSVHLPQLVGSTPTIGILPPDAGVALSQITSIGGANNEGPLAVRIDGNVAFKVFFENMRGSISITPPLIVPPGALLELFTESGPGASTFLNLTITGYTLPAAFFGE